MKLQTIKICTFSFFGTCILGLVIMALLGIWEVVNSEIAVKSIVSLFVVGFGSILVFAVGQKLFENK